MDGKDFSQRIAGLDDALAYARERDNRGTARVKFVPIDTRVLVAFWGFLPERRRPRAAELSQ